MQKQSTRDLELGLRGTTKQAPTKKTSILDLPRRLLHIPRYIWEDGFLEVNPVGGGGGEEGKGPGRLVFWSLIFVFTLQFQEMICCCWARKC